MNQIKRGLLLAAGITLGVALLAFGLMNQGSVEVNFYFGSPVRLPIWLLVLCTVGIGWVIPRLLGIRGQLRWSRERRSFQREIEALQQEVLELRNIPLALDPNEAPRSEHEATQSPKQASLPAALPRPPRRHLLPASVDDSMSDVQIVEAKVTTDD